MKCLALLLASLNPLETIAEDRVDVVENNRFYDEQGRLVFEQQIFYDWSPEHGRHMVRAWRLVKDANQVPARDWEHGGYVTLWQDGEMVRRVRCDSVRETWLQFDPELVEDRFCPRNFDADCRTCDAAR